MDFIGNLGKRVTVLESGKSNYSMCNYGNFDVEVAVLHVNALNLKSGPFQNRWSKLS